MPEECIIITAKGLIYIMRVLMVEHFLPGNTYTFELIKELSKITKVDLLTKKDAGVIEENENLRVMKFLYPDGQNKIYAMIYYGISLLRLFKLLISKRYDLIHVQTFKATQFEMPLYKYAHKKGRKIAHTVHNLLPHEAVDSDKKKYQDFYHICDLLIVHNDVCKQRLVSEFGVEGAKICVIPHGTYPANELVGLNSNGKKTYLVFGAIRKYKGIEVFLQAISKLPVEIRNSTEFIIAGKQNKNLDDTDYEDIIKTLRIEECTKFVNRRIEDDELPSLFGEADYSVFPYREIYGSGALLMAYSYKKPVIASDVPVFIEETDNGETGYLFVSEDSDDLARVIEKSYYSNSDEYNHFKNSIKELVISKYNWKVSALKTKESYSTICK